MTNKMELRVLSVIHISTLVLAVYLYHAPWLDGIRYSSVFLQLFIVPLIIIPIFILEFFLLDYLTRNTKGD